MAKQRKADFKVAVVGIGASAGGLEALREFVGHLVPGGRSCYVIAQHLSPSHRSMLMELLARETKLQVKELTRSQVPSPDVVYITPPNHHVELKDGRLVTRTPKVKTGPQPSVDLFFASLALEREEQAVAVVFSGTGSDGARGIQAIKAAGGITIAQDDSAKYNGMPNAAIATGCVDLVLPPKEVARGIPQLLGSDDREKILKTGERLGSSDTYVNICAVIRSHAGIDFASYRSSTILRRLSRRMNLLHLPDLEAYLGLLNSDPGEIDRLVRELLIGVTSFFRDPAVWRALRGPVERLIASKEHNDSIRVWVPGCSSGEEAYSLAILFSEAMRKLGKRARVQIFASDLDSDALARGRRGLYPSIVAEQIKPALLRRYFTPVATDFSVKQELREMIVFSRHNIVQDPPFSKLDLISCRNLFIYFTPDLQRRVLERFHYALNDAALLLLGKSETIGELSELFELTDRTNKIFRAGSYASSPFRPSAFTPLKLPSSPDHTQGVARPKSREARANAAIAKHFGPPTIIVDANDKPLHIAGAVKAYLQVPTGVSQFDLFSLIDADLRAEVRALLLRSRREHLVVRSRLHTAEHQGDKWQYRIVIHPHRDEESDEELSIVAFITVRALLEEGEEEVEETGSRAQVKELEHELLAMREHLHTMVNELETSNEELQSLNEELQSANEELQSTNEELETSNEELQSTNEELTTVNQEMIVKSDALNEANSFQNSVLESISDAVIVTDKNLKIQRYNAAALKVFKLHEDLLGEPLEAAAPRFRIPDLREMMETVVREGSPRSKSVRAPRQDRHFQLLVHPCLNSDEQIIGAILSLHDVSRLAKTNARLRRSRDALAEETDLRTAVLDSAPAQIAVLDKSGRIIVVNEAWRQFARENGGSDESFSIGRNYLSVCKEAVDDLSSDATRVAEGLNRVLLGDTDVVELRYTCHSPTERRWFKCVMRRASRTNDQLGALVMHINISSEVLLEQSMAKAQRLAEEANRAKSSFLANMSHELRTPLNAIIGFAELVASEAYGTHSHPKYAEYGEDIAGAANHLLRMINQVLDLSKIESGRLELEEEPVDLAICQAAAFKLFEQRAKERGVRLEAHMPKTLPRLFADEGAVNQILINLIGNAMKFIVGKGTITCSAKYRRARGEVVLTISDDGVGIAPEDLSRIVEPFAQVRSTLTSNNSGVGLGLSLVKGLVQMHEAELEVQSGVGRGTSIVVIFPRSRVLTSKRTRVRQPLPAG